MIDLWKNGKALEKAHLLHPARWSDNLPTPMLRSDSNVIICAGDQTKDPAREAAAATEATDPQTAIPAEGAGEEGATRHTQSVNDLVEGEKEEELSVEEQGRRIASQWTHDPEASGHAEVTLRTQETSLSGKSLSITVLLPPQGKHYMAW